MRLLSAGFACNNACIFCAQGELRAERPEAVPDTSVIAEGEAVAFVGGEPTLRPELAGWIADADRRGARVVVLQTNGRRLADRSLLAALGQASKKLVIEVSLQGGTAPVHDYHTGSGGSFAETVRGLAAARAAAIPFGVTTVVTRSNFRNLGEVVRLAHHLGARSLVLTLARPFGVALRDRDRVIAAPELALPYVSLALAEARRLRLRAHVTPLSGSWDGAGPEAHVGIGEVEVQEAAAPEPVTRANGKVSLQLYGRPAPGRGESRGPGKQSGDALRALFPGLFGEEKG